LIVIEWAGRFGARNMKGLFCIIWSACVVLAVGGCASKHGGTVKRHDEATGWEVSSTRRPLPSPTFRPGMTPKDIPDPNRFANLPPGQMPPSQPSSPPAQ